LENLKWIHDNKVKKKFLEFFKIVCENIFSFILLLLDYFLNAPPIFLLNPQNRIKNNPSLDYPIWKQFIA
jgi:hypothetical protein